MISARNESRPSAASFCCEPFCKLACCVSMKSSSTAVKQYCGKKSRRMKRDIELRFERAVDLVHHFKNGFELQSRPDRLHPQMIFLIDHNAHGLFPVHHDRAAEAFRGVLAADQMPLDEHLLFERGQVL